MALSPTSSRSSGGGGGSISVTDGTTTVNPTTALDFTKGQTVTDAGGGQANVAPTPIAARVFNSALQAIPNTTPTVITFDSERYDYGNLHSTVSNTGRLTAPVKGIYSIGGIVTITGGAAKLLADARIRLNGATLIGIDGVKGEVIGDTTYLMPTCHWEMVATDYVELQVNQQSGGSVNTAATAAFSLEFWMALIVPT